MHTAPLYRLLPHCAGLVILMLAFSSLPGTPLVRDGVLDLRSVDWGAQEIVELAGSWRFQPGLVEQWQEDGELIAVPGNMRNLNYRGNPLPMQGSLTYFLKVHLPAKAPPLALHLPTIYMAHQVWVNGEFVASAGTVGKTKATSVPAYHPQTVSLTPDQVELRIVIQLTNFHHWRGGMFRAPELGSRTALTREVRRRYLRGSFFEGLLFSLGIVFLLFYAFRPALRFNLYFGLFSLCWGQNIFMINEHLGYEIIGTLGWHWAYRMEFAILAGMFWLLIRLMDALFPKILSRWEIRGATALSLLIFLLVLSAPQEILTYAEIVLPVTMYLTLIMMVRVLSLATLRREPDAAAMLVMTVCMILIVILSGAFITEPVSRVNAFHVGIAVIILIFAGILARRSGVAFRLVESLSVRLETANATLAERNRTLEAEVKERTAQLVEAETRAHALDLEKKDRDMATLSANNLMKMKFQQNLIGELTAIVNEDKGQLRKQVKLLINRLKGHSATEQKLQVLQEDVDRINSEFYARLQEKYPTLSKTEREICAYLKLNLSSKDIAELRRTSLNTVNVTRHRLRKKLGLARGEELDAFIQQI
ncbi:MAG: 7TM diverse intracellular signaling domain-containing protein [Bacteroidota bacterium]